MTVKAQGTISLASVKTVNDASQYALQKAEEAEASANDAKTSADEANTQATYATSYANTALGQLGIVEDVVGVLKLLSTNAEYQLTNDTEISEGKWYFTRSGYAGGSYSGSIATFETTAGDNIESLEVSLSPIQAGSGTPSPSNVRAISGRTEVVTSVSGFNQWDEEWELGAIVNGANYTTSRNIRSTNYIPCSGGTTYYSRCSAQIVLFQYDANKSLLKPTTNIPYILVNANTTFTTLENTQYMRFYVQPAYGTTYNNDISINYPSTDHDYHAYNGTTYTAALGRTVYGGTLDVTSGVLTVDRAFRTFDGSENWETINQGLRYYGGFGGKAYSTKDVSNMLTYATSDPTRNPNSYTFTVGGFINVGVPYTVAEWKSLLATTNLQVVYELATPQTYQLTPQQVATLLGVNNVWADCGSVSVAVKSTYSYAVVTNPVIADIANYYEIVSIDEAVQDYVVSRLAVTSAGLWVQDPNMNTKILLSSTDGVVIYGPTGTIIGKYGSTAQVGDASSFHIEMDGTELGFYQGSQRVAYINNNQLYITQSVVLQQMDLGTPVASGGLGQWSWKVHPNGQNPSRNNLNLKWIG